MTELESRLNVLLPVVGSHGDVHPFIGIGLKLRARGHRARIITNEHFEPLVRQVGLDFSPLGTDEEYRRMLAKPELWHRGKGPRLIFEYIGELARPLYAAMEPLLADDTVVVHSSLALGARLIQEKHGVPTATVHLQPASFRSVIEPARMPGLPLSPWIPASVKRAVYKLLDRFVIDPRIGPPLNTFRTELGLPPVRSIAFAWWDSPQCVIGLFPEWFAAGQPDWPPQTRLAGFPLYDENDATPMNAALQDFLNGGTPPIAFTFGTAMWRAEKFFIEAVDACRYLNRRGLILTRHEAQVPRWLPIDVMHVPFAPFGALLPRCAALVHHGGIGTSAQGMAAGIPHLVTPFTHDQPDNAGRMRKLGVAAMIPPKKFRARRVADILQQLLVDPVTKERCAAVAEKFAAQNALERVCDWIEELARGGMIAGSGTGMVSGEID